MRLRGSISSIELFIKSNGMCDRFSVYVTQYSILKGIDFFLASWRSCPTWFFVPYHKSLEESVWEPLFLWSVTKRVYLSRRRGNRIVFDSFITSLEHMHASKKKMFFHPRGFCILDEKAAGTAVLRKRWETTMSTRRRRPFSFANH